MYKNVISGDELMKIEFKPEKVEHLTSIGVGIRADIYIGRGKFDNLISLQIDVNDKEELIGGLEVGFHAASPNHIYDYCLGESDKKPVDFDILNEVFPTKIQRIYVNPAYRDIGIGSYLMSKVINMVDFSDEISNKLIYGYMEPEFGKKDALIDFYGRYGFKVNSDDKTLITRIKN